MGNAFSVVYATGVDEQDGKQLTVDPYYHRHGFDPEKPYAYYGDTFPRPFSHYVALRCIPVPLLCFFHCVYLLLFGAFELVPVYVPSGGTASSPTAQSGTVALLSLHTEFSTLSNAKASAAASFALGHASNRVGSRSTTPVAAGSGAYGATAVGAASGPTSSSLTNISSSSLAEISSSTSAESTSSTVEKAQGPSSSTQKTSTSPSLGAQNGGWRIRLRLPAGSYSSSSQLLNNLGVAFLGIICALGIAPSIYAGHGSPREYCWLLSFRAFLAVLVCLLDAWTLKGCEEWEEDGQAAMDKYGYDAFLADLGRNEGCTFETVKFGFCSILQLVALLYLIQVQFRCNSLYDCMDETVHVYERHKAEVFEAFDVEEKKMLIDYSRFHPRQGPRQGYSMAVSAQDDLIRWDRRDWDVLPRSHFSDMQ
ncbi:unnamed protein product [Amoebophrya sp. A25]|nr:unnamed protein product [Amoebophrya sp. A25]|eukprot:GSA25T00020513001.1